jgi:hypothetical protein
MNNNETVNNNPSYFILAATIIVLTIITAVTMVNYNKHNQIAEIIKNNPTISPILVACAMDLENSRNITCILHSTK